MKKNNFSTQRLESDILSIVNKTLLNEIYDQDIRKCSFTGVKLTNDNSYVTIYVDTYDRKQIDYFVKKLTDARGIFRTAIAKNTKTYKTPEVIFKKDESIDNTIKIEKILDNLKINK